MPFYIGRITRHVSKNHHEYFDGVIGTSPVKAFWSKKPHTPDVMFICHDEEKINFISKKNEAKGKAAAAAASQSPAAEGEHKA